MYGGILLRDEHFVFVTRIGYTNFVYELMQMLFCLLECSKLGYQLLLNLTDFRTMMNVYIHI